MHPMTRRAVAAMCAPEERPPCAASSLRLCRFFLCEARTQRSGSGNGDSGKLKRDLPHATASLAAPTEQPERRRHRQVKYAGRLGERALKVWVSRRKA
jgi:hypothetical protein